MTKQIVFLISLLGLSVWAQAQPSSYSPASRIGLGQLRSYDMPVQQAMGGISTAFHDNIYTNASNPAALGWLRAASLDVGVFAEQNIYTNASNPAALGWLRAASLDVGVFAEQNEIRVSDGNFDYWTGNISHLNLSFPIFNPINDLLNREERDYNLGMMLGLMPFSEIGYDIVTDIDDDELGSIYGGNIPEQEVHMP